MEVFGIFLDFITQYISIGPVELPFSILDLVLRFVLPVLGMVISYIIILWTVKRFVFRSKLSDDLKNKIIRYLRIILKLLILIGSVAAIGNLLGSQVSYWFGRFLNILNEPFFVSGKTRISVITLVMLLPVFYISSWSGKYVRRILDSSLFEQFGLDEAKRFSIGSLARYFVMILVFLFGLSIVGIDLSALSVILGVLGLGLGFGLQSIVSNFFAGLIIISTRPIKEGDRVLVNGYDGIVQNIRFISTDIKTFENQNIILPNSYFVDNAVHNYSYTDRKVVIVNEVGVSYNADLEEVQEILKEINDRNPYRSAGPENVIRILSFGDNGINVALRTMVRDVASKADAFSWTNMEIWKQFKVRGVEIPFPQRDVHIKSMAVPETVVQDELEESEREVAEEPEELGKA